MDNIITVAGLYKKWEADIKPHVFEMFGDNTDEFAASWMEYLDLPLARSFITDLQWRFAENYLHVSEASDSWADEFSRLLNWLGIELLSYSKIDVDVMGLANYSCEIKCGGIILKSVCSKYTHKGELTRDDVLESALLDYSDFNDHGDDFDYYCRKHSLDDLDPDSRLLFEKDRTNFISLPTLFSQLDICEPSEALDGLESIVWKL